MSGLSKRKPFTDVFVGITATIIGGLALYFIIEKVRDRNTPSKVEVVNPIRVLPDSTDKPNDSTEVGPPVTPGDEKTEKETKSPPVNSGSDPQSTTKENKDPDNVINKSAKARFAILALSNDKKDNQLAGVFVNWLEKYGRSSYSVLLSSFINRGYFSQVMDGNSSVLLNTDAKEAAEYICLVNSRIRFEDRKEIKNLVIAKCSYDVKIVDTKSGIIVDEFLKSTENYPGVSEQMATNAALEALTEYLKKRTLTL